MKKLLFPLIAIFALTVTANAQHKMGKSRGHRNHEKGMIAKELNFSEAQKKSAKLINEDFQQKMKALNAQENITVKEMRERKKAIMQDRKTKMDGLLTTEQKAKQVQLKNDRKAKMEATFAKRMDKMKTNLNLTDDQVAKLKAQRAVTKSKAESIKNNQSLSMDQKKAQMMALRAEAKTQSNNILTPEQLKKKEDMKKNHGGRRAKR